MLFKEFRQKSSIKQRWLIRSKIALHIKIRLHFGLYLNLNLHWGLYLSNFGHISGIRGVFLHLSQSIIFESVVWQRVRIEAHGISRGQ